MDVFVFYNISVFVLVLCVLALLEVLNTLVENLDVETLLLGEKNGYR